MKREIISLALNGLDERHISDTAVFSPGAVGRSPERTVSMKKKRILTLALAAALILALGATAWALGLSIHRQRQAELRKNGGLTEGGAPAYVEYVTPEESTAGVILLSAINDGGVQRVFLNVSPVTEEELALTQHPVQFSLDGGATWEQAMTAGEGGAAYDAQSRTLTVSCMFGTEGRSPGEALTIRFRVNGERELGSVSLCLTDPGARLVSLPEPVVLTNPATGNPVSLLSVELRGNKAVWLLETEDAAWLYGDHSGEGEEDIAVWNEKTAVWLNWLDEQFRGMRLLFADGTSCGFSGAAYSEQDGDQVRLHVDYDRLAIDPSQVVAVEIGGEHYDLG